MISLILKEYVNQEFHNFPSEIIHLVLLFYNDPIPIRRLPFICNNRGKYILTNNLYSDSSDKNINISASNVNIDFNRFMIIFNRNEYCCPYVSGINIDKEAMNINILNGIFWNSTLYPCVGIRIANTKCVNVIRQGYTMFEYNI